MEKKEKLSAQLLAHPLQHQPRCPPLQLSWIKFRAYIRHCIVYSPETFRSQNELCQRVEARIEDLKPRNSMESGLKALNAGNILPSHDIAAPLATTYFNTWEKLYRVIHIPPFWKQYHDICTEIRQSSLGFKILMLAILVLGQRATVQGSVEDPESIKARLERFSQWTDCVKNYCVLLVEKKRLDLTAIQTLCLFTLYRATTCDRNEAVKWTQRLVKSAVQTNLHIDLSKLNSISPFEVEIRRRLWLTILEIDLQVSLEHGNSLPWTANMDHEGLELSNLDDVEVHPHSTLIPSEKSFTSRSECSIQRVLRRCGKLRRQLLRETFSNANEKWTNDPTLTYRLVRFLLKRLDSISISPDVCTWDTESKLLLRLHVLRASLKVMQGLTFRAVDFSQLHNALTVYYKYALDYLQIYFNVSLSARNGSLLSSTLFEALSPVMYIESDAFHLSRGVPSPSQKIINFVRSWSKYKFEDLDCLTDRAVRERLMFYFLSHYLESNGPHSNLASSRYETASWRYGRLCLALSQRRRYPIFYMEISEMARSGHLFKHQA